MNESAETHLAAEIAFSETLMRLAVDLAAELIIREGGSVSHVRARLYNSMPGEKLGPQIPRIIPAAGQGYDAAAALDLANDKTAKAIQALIEQAATAVVKEGIKLSRD